jgi:uncharacterized membrane protein
MELIVQAYSDQRTGKTTLNELKRLENKGEIEFINAALLRKSEHGTPSAEETEDVDALRGGLFGAVIGGILGVFGGPVGIVAGAIAGGAAGATSASIMDWGFPDEALEQIQNSMKPNSSAVVLLIEDGWLERTLHALSSYDGKLIQHNIADDVADKVREEARRHKRNKAKPIPPAEA